MEKGVKDLRDKLFSKLQPDDKDRYLNETHVVLTVDQRVRAEVATLVLPRTNLPGEVDASHGRLKQAAIIVDSTILLAMNANKRWV